MIRFFTFLRNGFFLWISILPGNTAQAAGVQFSFYGAEVMLNYDPSAFMREPVRVDAAGLTSAWRWLEQRSYRSLLEDVQRYKSELRLNDWMYYQLLNTAIAQLMKGGDAPARELTTAYLLVKSGYDIRVTFSRNELYVNAYVLEDLYEVPIIEDAGRQFANLTAARLKTGPLTAMYMLDIPGLRPGKTFSFNLAVRPALPERPHTRLFSFTYRHVVHEISLQYDEQWVELLKSYPLTGEMNYINAAASTALRNSLVPALNEKLDGLTTAESLELLAAVTRSGFVYGEDNVQFGRSKPMVADELFFYPRSDCEDRTALFFFLVKELLGLPMVVIAYDDHISLAVSAPGIEGDIVAYNGLRYLFCDPTGPSNSWEIGRIPEGYEHKSFEIIGEYPDLQR